MTRKVNSVSPSSTAVYRLVIGATAIITPAISEGLPVEPRGGDQTSQRDRQSPHDDLENQDRGDRMSC